MTSLPESGRRPACTHGRPPRARRTSPACDEPSRPGSGSCRRPGPCTCRRGASLTRGSSGVLCGGGSSPRRAMLPQGASGIQAVKSPSSKPSAKMRAAPSSSAPRSRRRPRCRGRSPGVAGLCRAGQRRKAEHDAGESAHGCRCLDGRDRARTLPVGSRLVRMGGAREHSSSETIPRSRSSLPRFPIEADHRPQERAVEGLFIETRGTAADPSSRSSSSSSTSAPRA
jgi:hypothetical protein